VALVVVPIVVQLVVGRRSVRSTNSFAGIGEDDRRLAWAVLSHPHPAHASGDRWTATPLGHVNENVDVVTRQLMTPSEVLRLPDSDVVMRNHGRVIRAQKHFFVSNTTGVSDCPTELWKSLDLENIQKQFGALKVEKNGPHFWMMDSQTSSFGETATFGGIEARWAARLNPAVATAAQEGSVPYKVVSPQKTQKMVYSSKGSPSTNSSIPTATSTPCRLMTNNFRLTRSRSFGETLKLPKGWQFRTKSRPRT